MKNKNSVYIEFRKFFRKYWLWFLLVVDLLFYVIEREDKYLIGAIVILVIIGLRKIMFRKEDENKNNNIVKRE